MKRILIIGCGDVAMRTLPLLVPRYRVYALVRNPAYCENLRKAGATPIIGDLDNRASLRRLAGIADEVLHFAPPNPPLPASLRQGKQNLVHSLPPLQKGGWGGFDARTRNLLSVLSLGVLPDRLVYISTSGVYGDCGGARVSETQPVHPASARGKLRVDAEQQIRDWARRNRVKASILRVPGIYAVERLPLERLRAGSPAIDGDADSYSNHIHADDLARISVAALQRGKACRVYHATDDDEMKMGDYFDVVADAYHLPRPPRMSRAEVQSQVSPMMWSFMNESRRMSNQRIKRELKVRLAYPNVADFLAKSAMQK